MGWCEGTQIKICRFVSAEAWDTAHTVSIQKQAKLDDRPLNDVDLGFDHTVTLLTGPFGPGRTFTSRPKGQELLGAVGSTMTMLDQSEVFSRLLLPKEIC